MPRVPKHPKSLWRSSPLSGLKIPDNLRLPAETRHHHRNLLSRKQKTHNTNRVAENVSKLPQIPSDSSNVHGFRQLGRDEDNARERTEMSLYPQQRTKSFGCILDESLNQKASLELASTTETVPEDNSPTSGTNVSMASSPRSHTANDLPDDYNELLHGENQLSDSDNSSEWSHTLSSNDSGAQDLDEDGDEMPLAEALYNNVHTALLFPSKQFQSGLHTLSAWLRQVVQIEPDSFTVVDPYDFISVLSFDSLQREEKSKLDVIIRLRCQFPRQSPHKDISLSTCSKRILIPFT